MYIVGEGGYSLMPTHDYVYNAMDFLKIVLPGIMPGSVIPEDEMSWNHTRQCTF